MFQDLFIFGSTGRVGKTLISQIFEKGDTDQKRHGNPTRIVGMASKSRMKYDASGLSEEDTQNFLEKKEKGVKYENLLDLIRYVSSDYSIRSENKRLTFVDVTAVEREMLKFHTKVIEATPYGLVTANKLPLVAADMDLFRRLTSKVERYGYRCSVMAGAEAVSKIRDLRDLGDLPTEISGCFSGTLGYITTELEKGRKLSDIVREARAAGYTEPHPSDDLSGSDVGRKIIILARTAGYDVSNIIINSFIPKELLEEESVPIFMENLKTLDEDFAKRILYAQKRNCTLRYIASFNLENNSSRIEVRLKEVPRDSPLGSLQGTRNKIVVRTKTYGQNFYSVEAPGAGLEVTAQNIRRDLLKQISNRVVNYN